MLVPIMIFLQACKYFQILKCEILCKTKIAVWLNFVSALDQRVFIYRKKQIVRIEFRHEKPLVVDMP